MRLAALAALPLLVLAACSREAPAPVEPAPASDAPATLGGVDLGQPLRAVGNEPFWGVDLTGSEMVYGGPDRPEQRARQPRPLIQGTTAIFTGQTTGGAPLIVTLIATECSDGMSDRTYPLVARVEVKGEKLTGCAASVASLATAGEQGPVAPAAPAAQPAG